MWRILIGNDWKSQASTLPTIDLFAEPTRLCKKCKEANIWKSGVFVDRSAATNPQEFWKSNRLEADCRRLSLRTNWRPALLAQMIEVCRRPNMSSVQTFWCAFDFAIWCKTETIWGSGDISCDETCSNRFTSVLENPINHLWKDYSNYEMFFFWIVSNSLFIAQISFRFIPW